MGILRFETDGHKYFHDGKPIPGITQIIKEMGFMGEFEPQEYYLDRGKKTHLACEYLDKGCLDWDSVDEAILPRVKAYQKFKEDYKFIPRMTEQPVHSHRLNVACTPDRMGIIDNYFSVIEIKNGGRQKWHRLQLSVQDICIREELEDSEILSQLHRYSLELKSDGIYKLLRFKEDEFDFHAAESLVTLYHWIKEGKRK